MFELRKRHKLTNVIPDRQIKLNEVVIVEETHVLIKVENRPGGGIQTLLIKIPVNTPVEFQNSNNSVAKDISKNDDDIDYGRANRLK